MNSLFQSHSETSQAAAEQIESDAPTLKGRVLFAIVSAGPRGMTDEEVQLKLGMNPSTQRPRRVDLVNEGLVVDSGTQRLTSSKRQAVVWIAAQLAPERVTAEPPIDLALERAGFKSLEQYLNSMTWHERRTRYFETHDPRCSITRSPFGIQLHHITYARIGNELDEDLVPLSAVMHRATHKIVTDFKVPLRIAHRVVQAVWDVTHCENGMESRC